MEQDPILTVIIPHYNIPDLLMRCLDSIPVSPDIQVIVVDDCSPEADTYRERYPALSRPYLEMYTTPGSGDAGRARNIGIEHARGRWITFMDADDLFEDLAGIVADYLDRPEDVLFFKARAVMSDDLTKPANLRTESLKLNQAIENKDEGFLRYKCFSLRGKFIKRELVDRHHIRCNHARYTNDGFCSVQIGFFAEHVALIDKVTYILTQRDGSLTSGQNKTWEEFRIRLNSYIQIQDFLDEHISGYAGDIYAKWLIIPLWRNNKLRYFRALAAIKWSQSFRVVKVQLTQLRGEIKKKLSQST